MVRETSKFNVFSFAWATKVVYIRGMEDVRRRIPHTIRRKGIYYFQRRVPVDLVEAFGFVHFKERLGTADPMKLSSFAPVHSATVLIEDD